MIPITLVMQVHGTIPGRRWSRIFQKKVYLPAMIPVGSEIHLFDTPDRNLGPCEIEVLGYVWFEDGNRIECEIGHKEAGFIDLECDFESGSIYMECLGWQEATPAWIEGKHKEPTQE